MKKLRHQVGNYGNRFEVVTYTARPWRVKNRWVFDTLRAAYEDGARRERMTLADYIAANEAECGSPLNLSFDPRRADRVA